MNAVEAVSLGYSYASGPVLTAVDLLVGGGERVAVAGPNGSGKTTLLRILATLTRPAGGTLRILGRDPAQERPAIRRRLGYAGHAPALYPELTAGENLDLFCALRGLPRSRAAEVLERVEVTAATAPVRELSRGTQQRVSLARSLLNDPELWILDEPDTGLDDSALRRLDALASGRSLVVATHDRKLARTLCDRVVVLSAGALTDRTPLRVLET